jgi:hypothetical protein
MTVVLPVVAGGNLPYIYKNNVAVRFQMGTITNLTEGVYKVTITESNNCGILEETYTIVNPPLLEVSLQGKKKYFMLR